MSASRRRHPNLALRDFEPGTFVQRNKEGRPKAFITGVVARPGDYYQAHELFSLTSMDRREWLTRNLEPADREPTEEEWAAFVAWQLGGGDVRI